MTRELWATKVQTERGISAVKTGGGYGWIDSRQNEEERMDRACDDLVAAGVVVGGRWISLTGLSRSELPFASPSETLLDQIQ